MPKEHVRVWVQSHDYDSSRYPEYELVSAGPPLVLRHRGRGFFASRLPEFALTGRGETADEARDKVERMFRATVQAVRSSVDLWNKPLDVGEWLTYLGVTWQWLGGLEDELVYQ